MTEIKLARPIKWKDAEPSEAGFIHNYTDIIVERKQWQAALDKEKERTEKAETKLKQVYEFIGDGTIYPKEQVARLDANQAELEKWIEAATELTAQNEDNFNRAEKAEARVKELEDDERQLNIDLWEDCRERSNKAEAKLKEIRLFCLALDENAEQRAMGRQIIELIDGNTNNNSNEVVGGKQND